MVHTPEFAQGAGVLSRAAGMVADAHTDFNAYSSRLTGQISDIQGKWGGTGASAFFTLHQAWTEKQKVIVDALDDFQESLGATERDNSATDEDQAAAYVHLTGRLG